MKMITLRQIQNYSPAAYLVDSILKSKVDFDEPFPVLDILNNNGLRDAIQCLHCTDELKDVAKSFYYLCVNVDSIDPTLSKSEAIKKKQIEILMALIS